MAAFIGFATPSQASPLNGTIWQVESVDRGGITDRSMITMNFHEAGRVAGYGGCNRYFGSVEESAGALTFSGVGATRRACATSLMDQEQRFFTALGDAASYTIESDMWLVVFDASENERIRAIRVETDPTEPEAQPTTTGNAKPELQDGASTVSHRFECESFGSVSLRFLGPNTIGLNHGSGEQALSLQLAASGARYANDTVEFWNKGDEAMLTVDGVMRRCRAT